MMKQKLVLLLTALLLLTGCSSGGSGDTADGQDDGELETIDVVLDWYPNAVHAFLYEAEEKGYFAEEGLQAARGLGRRVLHGPVPQADELAVGEGGPAELDGKQMGVYRAAEELYYAVELRCPHLGCRLEWNPDDKSWDCPCHGSRFDVQGRCLTEPAQTDLPACCRRRS